MSARPSGRNAIPLQNTSHARSWTANVPVCTSHTAARELDSTCLLGSFSEPATMSTLPVRKRPTWIGLIGIVYGKVVHCPDCVDCASAARRDGDPPGRISRRHHTTANNAATHFRLLMEPASIAERVNHANNRRRETKEGAALCQGSRAFDFRKSVEVLMRHEAHRRVPEHFVP